MGARSRGQGSRRAKSNSCSRSQTRTAPARRMIGSSAAARSASTRAVRPTTAASGTAASCRPATATASWASRVSPRPPRRGRATAALPRGAASSASAIRATSSRRFRYLYGHYQLPPPFCATWGTRATARIASLDLSPRGSAARLRTPLLPSSGWRPILPSPTSR